MVYENLKSQNNSNGALDILDLWCKRRQQLPLNGAGVRLCAHYGAFACSFIYIYIYVYVCVKMTLKVAVCTGKQGSSRCHLFEHLFLKEAM